MGLKKMISILLLAIALQKKVDKSIRLTPGFDSGAVVRLSLAGTDPGT